ncbi:MAG: NUDIX hydrolase [Dehalococcoidia bacterium]
MAITFKYNAYVAVSQLLRTEARAIWQARRCYNSGTVKRRIAAILRDREKKTIDDANLRTSAVLMPLFCDRGQYHVLFTERSTEVSFHKGQVCFPGGAQEPSDSGLLDTALREAEEEMGLKAEDVEVLGELDDITTFTSNHVISPFVAFIPHPYPFEADGREIKEIFSVPLSFLTNEANFREDRYAWEYGGHVIWGATAEILRQFIDLLKTESGAS